MVSEKEVKPTTVALPAKVREAVEADAAKQERSISYICAKIIEGHYASNPA